jgi:hypothetical protein
MTPCARKIVALVPVVLIVACNTVDPDQCWLNPTGGFGGADLIPIGGAVTSGDFPAPAHHPLDASDLPNPCIEPGSPCEEKCLTDYESRAAGCAGFADALQRKACQDDAYTQYRGCRTSCDSEANGKKKCTDKFVNCQNHAPKSCLKESGGQSVCAQCRERCNSGDPPSPQCKKCLF